jgi:hypothetical protein
VAQDILLDPFLDVTALDVPDSLEAEPALHRRIDGAVGIDADCAVEQRDLLLLVVRRRMLVPVEASDMQPGEVAQRYLRVALRLVQQLFFADGDL